MGTLVYNHKFTAALIVGALLTAACGSAGSSQLPANAAYRYGDATITVDNIGMMDNRGGTGWSCRSDLRDTHRVPYVGVSVYCGTACQLLVEAEMELRDGRKFSNTPGVEVDLDPTYGGGGGRLELDIDRTCTPIDNVPAKLTLKVSDRDNRLEPDTVVFDLLPAD